MNKERELWIDWLRVAACFMVMVVTVRNHFIWEEMDLRFFVKEMASGPLFQILS